MTKYRQRARDSVWWPGLKHDIDEIVFNCPTCCMYAIQKSEPLIPSLLSQRPWQSVGTDLFEWRETDYLLVVDYYSRFIEVAKLMTTTASSVISHLKLIFSHHGIPECLMSDNGPQYSAAAFEMFSEEYGFKHVTSSPRYPQANGAAERAVKTVKQLLEKNTDPYMANADLQIHTIGEWIQSIRVVNGEKVAHNSSYHSRSAEAYGAKCHTIAKERKRIESTNEEKSQ